METVYCTNCGSIEVRVAETTVIDGILFAAYKCNECEHDFLETVIKDIKNSK